MDPVDIWAHQGKFEVTETLRSARATVDTFGCILGRSLVLRGGSKAFVSGDTLTIPTKDPDLYVRVERLLAHLLFRSDSRARAKFVKQFVDRELEKATFLGKNALSESIKTSMTGLINILEGRRIESLWGLIYPGSATIMAAVKRKDLAGVVNPHDNLLSLIACAEAGIEIPIGRLEQFIPLVREGLQRVERRSLTASLVTARWLIGKVVEAIAAARGADPDDPRKRIKFLDEAARLLGQGSDPIARYYSDYGTGDPEGLDAAKGAVAEALRVELGDRVAADAMMADTEVEMQHILDAVTAGLTRVRSEEDLLSHNFRCVVAFMDISAKEPATPPPRPRDDAVRRLISAIRTAGIRERNRLEIYGTELDIEAYIAAHASGRSESIFRTDGRTPGLRLRILLDRSESMRFGEDNEIGSRIQRAALAIATLAKAAKSPNIDLSVWGFQAPADGEVLISKFDKDCASFMPDILPVTGDTPIHIAIAAAAMDLTTASDPKYILVVTDGAPSFTTTAGKDIPEQHLRLSVREQVDKARRNGIGVGAILIEDTASRDTTHEQMRFMFGSSTHWCAVSDKEFVDRLVGLVGRAFINHTAG